MKRLHNFYARIFVILCFIITFCYNAHCSKNAGPRKLSMEGTVLVFENPNVYLYGTIIDGQVLRKDNEYATNVRFNPAYSYLLYDETVLFCGDVSDQLNAVGGGPVIVTYKRSASRIFDGVACHNLVSADPVVVRK